ncbi:hypothetical protein EYC55_07085 [Xanthomonas oryzae]|nr:hypothetical protein EYR26_07005 [Xanthomonas oryzae]QBG95304.1 hypothetical protein EYC55_07085 [Xanthomonas oryzae]QBH00638.1 hypothetical protein EYC56_16810 [Xanthomonas oryzae]
MGTSLPDWQDARRRMDGLAELALRHESVDTAIRMSSRLGPVAQSDITAGANFCRWRFRPGRSRRYQNVRCRCTARVPSRYRTAQIPGSITG